MQLTPHDEDLLSGRAGEAAAFAMSIIVRMGEVCGAEGLMDITQAHIDSTIYTGEATLEFAERLASMDARVAVPSTMNVSGVDEHGWRDWPVPAEWADQAYRQMVAYQGMGCIPTWTCAPYQTVYKPKFGQQIAWGESNAIAFANSVLGARTERYPDLMDICAAITARVPAVGLHLDENRAGQLLLELTGVPRELQLDDAFWPVFGHVVGQRARDRVVVIDGLDPAVRPAEDDLKALGAGAASSGAVALFHLVGVTPEAPTRAAAFQQRQPEAHETVSTAELRAARAALNTAPGNTLDMVILGSPHFSLAEFRRLAPLVDGKRAHSDVFFLVTTSRIMRQLADEAGLLEPLQRFGARITVDTCILATPMKPDGIGTLMTNSAKYAYYSPGLLNADVHFGGMKECVNSAIAGRVAEPSRAWRD